MPEFNPGQKEIDEKQLSAIFGVLGCKGGVGATTLAVNLACAFTKGSTTLIDTNLQQPDAAIILAQEPEFTLLDLISRNTAIDKQVFEACASLLPGHSQVRLLSPPSDGQCGATISLTSLSACFSSIRPYADRWILDLSKHLDRHLVTLLDQCTHIVLVLEANLTSLAAARRWLTIFDELGYPQEKARIVLNRCGGKLKYLEEQVATVLAHRSITKLPNIYSLSEACSIAGEPIVVKHPRESYSKSVRQLAASLESFGNTPDVSAFVAHEVSPFAHNGR